MNFLPNPLYHTRGSKPLFYPEIIDILWDSSVKLTENKIDLLGAGALYDYLAKKDWWPKFLKDKLDSVVKL